MWDLFAVAFACLFLRTRAADFSYWDFNNETLGVRVLGGSCFSTCGQDLDGCSGDIFSRAILRAIADNKALLKQTVVQPALVEVAADCGPALRLTEAKPFQKGAAWQTTEQPLEDGFDTTFYYRISNRSQTCEERLDKDRFESERWYYCAASGDNFVGEHVDAAEKGGDGFAFVIQNAPNSSWALGGGGHGLGYEGIENSIAIEFDTFSNLDQEDPFYRHMGIHTAGVKANTLKSSALTQFVQLDSLGDSGVHGVRVTYFPTLRYDFFDAGLFSSTSLTRKFTGDRLGTLCVYHGNLTYPTICSPLDLGKTIDLDGGMAFVGFTAATGLHYQNHDILNWTFSTTAP